jgi:EcsC protein family
VQSWDCQRSRQWPLVYEAALNGIAGVEGVEDLAQSYSAQHRSADDAIDSLVSWQIAKASTAGFITGIGGILTLPVAIPANLAGVLYIQLRMIGAIAHLRGYDVRSDQVRTLAFACLAGSAALDILKDFGINIGAQLTRQIILRVPGEVLKRVNRAVGFRLVTKAGTRGVVNLVKVVPLAGGLVGGALDAAATTVIGRTAKQVFVPIPAEP